MKYLVTGAAGFIGSHLCGHLLSQGHDVVGLDCFTDYYARELKEGNLKGLSEGYGGLEKPGFRFMSADLNYLELAPLISDADGIFHLAAQPGVRASWGKTFQAYIDSNIRATQALLEAVKDNRGPRIVFASSSSVYGKTNELPTKETSEKRPLSPYGATKLAGEALCQLYHINYDVDVISLRYFTVFGPRQRPDMAFHRFFRSIIKGQEIRIFGTGEQTRDFTYVADIVAGTLTAMQKGVPGRAYNLGAGHQRKLNDVVQKIIEIAGKDTRLVFEPVQKGDVLDTCADTALAKKELGFSPETSLEHGLRAEYEWLKDMLS
jgi:nucleoside-diphosphate-sugar epimerase